MALIKDLYQSYYGITIPNCYWKVDTESGIMGGKTKLRVRISCFKDKATADLNQDVYDCVMFEITPDLLSADNFIAQAYVYAKTLPEFNGAVDA